MFDFSALSTHLTPRQPEAIWLEHEQFEQLIHLPTRSLLNEAGQWQLYLNALALLGFEQWLLKRSPTQFIDRSHCLNQAEGIYNLKINQFKLNLIIKEHLLDEVVEIPRAAIAQPDLAAHFYVLLEVSEEQQRVMIRGFLRHDRLLNYCHQLSPSLQNDHYHLPLPAFDPEPNHLLFYCDFLEPSAIPLLFPASEEARIRLGDWIQGVFTEGWQGIQDLFDPDLYLAWSARNPGDNILRQIIHAQNQRAEVIRCKLIDLEMDFQGQRTVLLVSVTEEIDQDLSVLVQLHPTGEERYLLPDIRLTLLSAAGKILQEVYSRTQDNYIQLKSFRGPSGIPFLITVCLGDSCIYENFQL
jgi:Protein of unknown function (DUF1822)